MGSWKKGLVEESFVDLVGSSKGFLVLEESWDVLDLVEYWVSGRCIEDQVSFYHLGIQGGHLDPLKERHGFHFH